MKPLNKNISVWRGDDKTPPPTNFHLWVKESGSIWIKLKDSWLRVGPSEGTVASIQAKLAGIDDTVKGYVDSQVGSLAQALVFKGGVPEGGLPANPKVGDTYVVGTAGDYAGETCEVGDTIICTSAKVGETAAKWLVVQKNLDGAVTKGDEQDWSGKLIVGTGGNMISGLIGTEGQIIQADANGDPTYVDPNYATSDVVNELSGRVAANSTAIATVNKNAGDAVTLARKANDSAELAQLTALEAKTTANEAKEGLKSKASKDVATVDAAGLMSAADKQQLNNLQDNLDSKVDKVAGKGLSTNDYTTDEKNKLAGIAAGALVNVIESVKVNGAAQLISSKEVDISIPTKLSLLTNDVYKIATSAEITAILN